MCAGSGISIFSKDANTFAQKYYLTAKEDLTVAEELINQAHFAAGVFHLQQSLEKLIKTIAALKGEFISGHETAAWLKFEISGEFEGAKEVTDFCRDLEEEVNRARYPSRQKGKILTPMEAFSEHYAKKLLEQTKKEFQRLVDYLNEKYAPNWDELSKEEGNAND